jgi:hypothetical protein
MSRKHPIYFQSSGFQFIFKETVRMKTVRYFIILCSFSLLVTSCSLFKPKYGCESNGRNVGAEKVLEMSKKEQKKAGKFKA